MTQTDGILAMLKAHPEGVTALDIMAAGNGMRAAARVSELRERGWIITTDLVRRGGATVALYRLREKSPLWGAQ